MTPAQAIRAVKNFKWRWEPQGLIPPENFKWFMVRVVGALKVYFTLVAEVQAGRELGKLRRRRRRLEGRRLPEGVKRALEVLSLPQWPQWKPGRRSSNAAVSLHLRRHGTKEILERFESFDTPPSPPGRPRWDEQKRVLVILLAATYTGATGKGVVASPSTATSMTDFERIVDDVFRASGLGKDGRSWAAMHVSEARTQMTKDQQTSNKSDS